MARRQPKRRGSGKSKKPGLFKQATVRAQMRMAGSWPLYECLITEDWREEGQIIQIGVVRRSPQGEMAVGGFLVDLGCLGVKNAMAISFPTIGDYRRRYRNSLMKSQPMTTCELDLAAKVVHEGIKYAESLGFKPHKDVRDAFLIMGEAHPENCSVEVPVGGKDGKPFFFAGPYDDVERIRRTLDRKVGPGNYYYLVPLGDPMMFGDDEYDEIEFEDWEGDED